jgi:quinol monooxygenase YgiN
MAEATMFGVYGRMTTQPGRRDEVVDLIREAARAGGDASGLIPYSINPLLTEPPAGSYGHVLHADGHSPR